MVTDIQTVTEDAPTLGNPIKAGTVAFMTERSFPLTYNMV